MQNSSLVLLICFTIIFTSNTVNGIGGLSPPYTRPEKAKVVIVGAGASGIAAASLLLENGINDIIILEAESRFGGRIDTVRFGDDFIDLGAHWVHGEKENVVFKMASEYDLLTKYSENESDTVFVDSTGKTVNETEISVLYNGLENINNYSMNDLQNYTKSVGDYFTEEYRKYLNTVHKYNATLAKSFLDWYEKELNTYDGSDSWFQTSGHGYTEYKMCEGYQYWKWKNGGYSSVFDLLMKRYPDPKKTLPVKHKIYYLSEVSKVSWNNLPEEYENKVLIECSDGRFFLADFVIMTVSLGVLKERAQSMFVPELPSTKLNAIKGLAFGTVDKIYMKFQQKWWPDNYSEFGLLWPPGDTCNFEDEKIKQEDCWYKQAYFFGEDNLTDLLYGWITGSAARYMEQVPVYEVEQKIVQLLNRFVGSAFSATVSSPFHFLRTTWATNPHFRGSYSYRSMETEALGASASQLAEPMQNKNGTYVLMFAGEATHSSHYSTVHGAIESGWREANRLLNNLR